MLSPAGRLTGKLPASRIENALVEVLSWEICNGPVSLFVIEIF
jgi:hypothetical protein